MTIFKGTRKPTGTLLAKTSGTISDTFNGVRDIRFNPIFFEMFPPKNLLEYRSVWMYLDLVFEASVATADRKITKVSIFDEGIEFGEERFYSGGPWEADVNRRIQLTLDLSKLGSSWKREVIKCYFPSNLGKPIDEPPFPDPFATLNLWRVDRLLLVNEGAK